MVKIYTFQDKSPHFIGWQAELLKRYLHDDYELIVMNNSSSVGLDIQIREECTKAGVRMEKVLKKDFSTGCFACAVPIQDCIDRFIGKDDENISVIMDSDLFLMKDFSFSSFMEGWDIAALPQSRDGGYEIIEYLWNCLVVLAPSAPNKASLHMGCGTILHGATDVGGMSYFYLRSNPTIRWRRIPSTGIIHDHPEVLGLIPENIRGDYNLDYGMEILNGEFLHFRGGSRWDNKTKEFYEAKENFIKKMVCCQ
jgi:hypothetical protein